MEFEDVTGLGGDKDQGGVRMSVVLDVGLGYHGETRACGGCSGFGVMEGAPHHWLIGFPSLLELFLDILEKHGAPGRARADVFATQLVL